MEPREFTGKTTEEAIQKASEYFDLPLNRLKVEVISTGSSGLLGFLGAKKAKVRVTPQEGSAESDVAEVMKELTGESPAGGGRASRRGGHGWERRSRVPRPAPAPEEESAQAVAEVSHEGRPREEEPPAPRQRVEEDPEVVASTREVVQRLVRPLDPEAQVSAQGGPHGIEVEVQSQEVGILIGRRGQTLEALQYLTTRIVSHQQGRPVRIHLDAGGYRQRRHESLENLALRMAEKARETGRPQAVGPFNAQERRLIHLALRHARDINTISRGRGELKKVLIALKH